MAKTDTTVYEIGFNLIPTLAAENVAQFVGDLKDKISSFEGEIIADEYPALIKLAYEMTKEIDNKNVRFTSAYFGWVKFAVSPEHTAELQKFVEGFLGTLRFILIKTVRENTLYSQKFAKPSKHTEGIEEQAPAGPIDEEVVDKKIDEMVEEGTGL